MYTSTVTLDKYVQQIAKKSSKMWHLVVSFFNFIYNTDACDGKISLQ